MNDNPLHRVSKGSARDPWRVKWGLAASRFLRRYVPVIRLLFDLHPSQYAMHVRARRKEHARLRHLAAARFLRRHVPLVRWFADLHPSQYAMHVRLWRKAMARQQAIRRRKLRRVFWWRLRRRHEVRTFVVPLWERLREHPVLTLLLLAAVAIAIGAAYRLLHLFRLPSHESVWAILPWLIWPLELYGAWWLVRDFLPSVFKHLRDWWRTMRTKPSPAPAPPAKATEKKEEAKKKEAKSGGNPLLGWALGIGSFLLLMIIVQSLLDADYARHVLPGTRTAPASAVTQANYVPAPARCERETIPLEVPSEYPDPHHWSDWVEGRGCHLDLAGDTPAAEFNIQCWDGDLAHKAWDWTPENCNLDHALMRFQRRLILGPNDVVDADQARASTHIELIRHG